jgi:hypothetical protein
MSSDERSDAELVRAALDGDDSFGCYLWLIAPPLGASLGFFWGRGGAVLGMLGALALCALILRLRQLLPAVRERKRAARELELRFDLAPLEQHEANACAALEQPGAPEAVLLFEGRALPHGGHRFIRIDLAAESTIRVRSTPFLHDLARVEEPQRRMLKIDGPLSAVGAERVRALLRELTPEALIGPRHFVRDGFPCAAVVLRRGAEPLRASLNLAGLPAELKANPCVRLLELMLELEAEVAGGRGSQLVGATSAFGDIEISMR